MKTITIMASILLYAIPCIAMNKLNEKPKRHTKESKSKKCRICKFRHNDDDLKTRCIEAQEKEINTCNLCGFTTNLFAIFKFHLFKKHNKPLKVDHENMLMSDPFKRATTVYYYRPPSENS